VLTELDEMDTPAVRLPVLDKRKRSLRDLRVSVTDRCNFRCPYCMPRDVFGAAHKFLPKREILTFEEISRIVRVSVELGVRKVRLTGGEPLLRSELPELVRLLRRIGDLDLALTTNGSLLERFAPALAEAGLGRVTVSLDSLDPHVFREMSDTDVPVETVLRGIEAARVAGLAPLKVNAVVRRGVNEASILGLARHFRGTDITVRFIEFMDVGTTNGWDPTAVVPAREILDLIDRELPIEPVSESVNGRVARRYRYRDGSGEIGVIASVSEPFCGGCTRARLSANGHLYTCLFAATGKDLRPVLRDGSDDDAVRSVIRCVWEDRDDRYSETRFVGGPTDKVEMSYLGG
jgi:GTP 3',8-cyclase